MLPAGSDLVQPANPLKNIGVWATVELNYSLTVWDPSVSAVLGTTMVDYTVSLQVLLTDFAYLHWHPDHCCFKFSSWWKSFVYSIVDDSEHRKLALALHEKDISVSAALILILSSKLFIHHESDIIILFHRRCLTDNMTGCIQLNVRNIHLLAVINSNLSGLVFLAINWWMSRYMALKKCQGGCSKFVLQWIGCLEIAE